MAKLFQKARRENQAVAKGVPTDEHRPVVGKRVVRRSNWVRRAGDSSDHKEVNTGQAVAASLGSMVLVDVRIYTKPRSGKQGNICME